MEGAPKRPEAGVGDQNQPGVLTFFSKKPDHPMKVESSCRPEVEVRESGPSNVTDLLHREVRLLWQQGSLGRKSSFRFDADDLASRACRAFIPSSRGDQTTLVVGQLKEGETCSLWQEEEARSPNQF